MNNLKAWRVVLLPLLALLVSLASSSERVGAQLTDWATLLGGADSEVGYAVATDVDGSVVVTGSFEGTTNIGGAQLSSAGYPDVFVAKFSRIGGLLWAKRLGGISTDRPAAVAVDKETGDVVVTGRFSLTATVDNQVLRSSGASDVFLVRFSKTGALQWALAFGGQGDDAAAGVAVGPNGDSMVTGQFSGRFTCAPTALTSVGGTDTFVAKVSLGGALQWCRRLGGSSDDSVGGIAVGDAGLFALTGTFGASTDLGGGTLSSAGQFDAFVAGYAVADGSYRWGRRMGGSGYDAGNAVAFDNAGAVMVTGYFGLFGGGVDFGGGVLSTQGGADAFVGKYNGNDGQYVWAGTFGGNLDDYANGVGVDQSGDVIIAGEFQGTARFAGISASSGGQFDAFVARFSSSGAPLWWRSYGDVLNDKAYGVAADFEGNYFVTGFSVFRIDLGKGALYSAGMSDAFLAKFVPAVVNTPTPTRTFTSTPLPPTPIPTVTRPPTLTFTPTRANSPTHTPTRVGTFARTNTPTSTRTPSRTATRRPATPSRTPTQTLTVTPTTTATSTSPSAPSPTDTSVPVLTPTTTSTQTPTVSFTPTSTRTATQEPATSPTTPSMPTCVGDCDGNGKVAVNELVGGVNILLGRSASACPAFENAEGIVDVAQFVKAVNNALHGCGD